MNPPPVTIPPAVLAAYPPDVRDCTWTPLPSGGGMSGGRVWRGDRDGQPQFALKRWPVGPLRIRAVHDRMEAIREFEFVPRLVRAHPSDTFVLQHDLRAWDVTAWINGIPSLLSGVSVTHLRAAGVALADLHRSWLPADANTAPCSAVVRRLRLCDEWEEMRFAFRGRPDDVAEVGRTVELVRRRLAATRADLLHFATHRGRLVGIHGDFWPENILFQHDRLTAVLDYGNVGVARPEVDLGRLFADVPGANRAVIAEAVAAYNSSATFDLSVPLVEVLASTGPVCNLANWHLRLTAGSPDAGLLSAALPRLRRLAALAVAG